ncbi:hypothetical protein Gotri_027552 [Gossypium trilobum]|uniref:Uncharacterized protein n=1 Tax=Gossypium trilobum TaxID=34281 RepID=A0A7J9FWQ3_9ROSI|nr:hypothetical protein [Gossypium trilobum]
MGEAGLGGFNITRISGLMVLLVFTSMECTLKDDKEIQDKWFERIHVWSESIIVEQGRTCMNGASSMFSIQSECEESASPRKKAVDNGGKNEDNDAWEKKECRGKCT